MLEDGACAGMKSSQEAAPIDPDRGVWVDGITNLYRQDAHRAEFSELDQYKKDYEAVQSVILFKALGWRGAGNG